MCVDLGFSICCSPSLATKPFVNHLPASWGCFHRDGRINQNNKKNLVISALRQVWQRRNLMPQMCLNTMFTASRGALISSCIVRADNAPGPGATAMAAL
jgi:hypothetical protein